MGNGTIAPRNLNLSSRWRWVVRFMPRTFYPRRKEPPVPIGQEAGMDPEPVWTWW